MKMKHLVMDQPSLPIHVSNIPSNSCLDKDDQEMASHGTSMDGETSIKHNIFCFFAREMDLNPTRMVLAELMGTFILVFCICGIIASTQLTRGQVGLMEYASTAGLTVIILIFSIGPISGAHVNPAVTIAFATFGHFRWSRVPFYVLAQTVGSVLATYVGWTVYGVKPDVMATRAHHGCISAFWLEFISTFIIMFLAASLTYQKSVGQLSGFVFGISIGLTVLVTGPVSGGSMNPARSLGPAIVSWNFKDIWVYLTAPIIGAVSGALMFHALRIRCRPCSPSASAVASLLAHSIPLGDDGNT